MKQITQNDVVVNGLHIKKIELSSDRVINVYFTNRLDGFSENPYDSLNLGLHVGDNSNNVIKNRKLLLDALGLNIDDLVVANQVHGSNIHYIGNSDRGRGSVRIDNEIPETDAMICDIENIPLMMLYADCIPVILFQKNGSAAAIIHAGWKGTAVEIAKKTLLDLTRLKKINANEVFACIGPGIGACCYKVTNDFVSDNFPGEGFKKNGECFLDLKDINKKQLIDSGMPPKNIYIDHDCTACDEKYFSYRRDGITGRNAAIVVIRNK